MKSAERIVGLDGLRGVAILLVVSYHLWIGLSGEERLADGAWLSLLYAGNTGVTLFFVLSGFLVCTPFIKSMQRGRTYSVKEYAVQRALRILPPYYVVALVGVLLTQNFDQLLPALLFSSHGWSVGYFSAVWWSLATEVQFYLLVPLFFLMACHPWRLPLLSLAALLLLVLYVAVICKWVVLPGYDAFALQFGLILSVFGQLPAFLVGFGLALVYHRVTRSAAMGSLTEHACIAGLLALLSWLLLPAAREGALGYMWHAPWHVLPEALVWGAVVWVMLGRSSAHASLLDNPVTRYWGRISFSLYLVHMPVLQLVLSLGGVFGLWVDLLLASLLSVAAAQLLYWLVEKPSLALKNQLLRPHLPSGIKV
ncbi:acyltransferase [Pseudomonas sp. BLCC-B13]|uniref:acyltransferase family protein n=1 Tax=Pseudomonas sp. BLCC-B13 TaxID=3025314 RepID=UPI00234F39F7|nr:acyltransferase [Pseudomonas sp. BLCC-B13]MDC7825883.1 acyltransferase [Pseudomonas sp. BLCC-B13]